jgi:hypothetical protein
MPHGEQSDHGTALPKPASQAGPAIPDNCRAARIGDATDFANCLVQAAESCPHGFASGSFHYCVHPQRETIIARTLAAESPSGN